MSGVTFDRLLLEGFGRYRDAVRFRFPEGLGVLVAPNESGKSTLLNGLIATVFGLPRSADGEDFGDARFRHRGGGAAFRGEVDTRADGRVIRISRAFETNEVRWSERTEAGWRLMFSEVHVPGARPAGGRYPDRLRDLLGIPSREIFEKTFFVSQPMPAAAAIDARLQELLSGAGGGRYGAALESLAARRDASAGERRVFGLSGRDAVAPRALERADHEIAVLRARIDADVEAVDALFALRAEISRGEESRDELRARVEATDATISAWHDWVRHRDRFSSAVARGRAARDALDRVRALEDEIAGARRSLASSWPVHVTYDPDAGPALEALTAAVDRAAPLEAQSAAVVRKLDDARRTVEVAEARLAQAFRWISRPESVVEDVHALKDAVARAAARQQRLAATEEAAEAARASLRRSWAWETIGEPAASVAAMLPERAADLVRRYDRAIDVEERWERARLDAAAGEEVFSGASEPARALLRSGGAPLHGAVRARDEAEAELAAAREDAARYAEARAPLAAAFADVSALPDDLDEVIERKIEFGGRRESLAADLARARDHRIALTRRRAVGGGVSAAAGFIVALWLAFALSGADGFLAIVWGLFSALVAGAAGYVASGRSSGYEMATRESELAAEMAAFDALVASAQSELGPLGAASLVDLLKARDRLKEWKRNLTALDELESRLRTPEAMTGLERRAAAWRARAAEMDALAGARLVRFGDDTAAEFARWERASAEAESLGARARDAALDDWEVGAFARARRLTGSELPSRWRALFAFAEAAGGPANATLNDLAAWLRSQDSAFWENAVAQARAWDLARATLADADTARAAEGADPEAEIAALRARVRPFDERTEVEGLTARVRAVSAAERDVTEGRARAAALADQARAVLEAQGHADAQVARLRAPLRDTLAAFGGSPHEALRRWRERRSTRGRLEASERTLREVLGTAGASSAEALEDAGDRAERDASAAHREIDALRARHASLLPIGASDEGTVEHDWARALEAAREARVELARVEAVLQAGRVREAAITERDVINVADAEERLAVLVAARERLRRDARVHAVAHRELRTAVTTYHAAYRDHLRALATAHFARIAGEDRRVEIGEAFAVSVIDAVGEPWTPAQLSQGARDQLFLSLRLAVADLLAYERRLPLIFDDAFVHCDDARLARIEATLRAAAADRQILLLSHRREFSTWGEPVTVERGGAAVAE